MTDPLGPLLDLPGIAEAVQVARESVNAVHQHPTNRRGWPTTAAEASVRAARSSAYLDGGNPEIPDDGEVADPVLAGALRVAEAIGPLLPVWQRAPLQALARLHLLAAADLVDSADDERLGRPRTARGVAGRLDLLANLLTGATKAPGPVLAAVVHGELLTLAPFGLADGVVARAAARLTVIGTGLDPKGLTVPEVAYLRRPERYREAAEGFASGEPDGVRGWVVLCCEAIEIGAREATSIADSANV
ncbi:oxidoreductase [Kibdelosporangium philippinense]|uniref:Oxidoreductase n=1 Tax=Kibdelosporangium philippinense TaxID=211113 RepID=A0ABS8ZNT9_9PSEU|nr:oxidoreductase [Kibdelosporangium philippinense]MCE7009380.1 oxidoreductase [Kibdelosporangium philippinense]